MSDIQLSLLGIYDQHPEILDAESLLLPAGVDRDVLVPRLLAETAELEILYPEPTTLQTVIRAWSTARRPSWERIYAALTAEYNPLHNYDRTETESGTDTGTVHTDDDSTDTGTVRNVEEISDTGSGTNSATTQGDVTGYNSNTFAGNDKQTTSGSNSSSASRDRDNTETRNLSRGRDVLETRNLANTRSLRAYGNIGVTTNAQMISGEIDVRSTDIYTIIADEFRSYFCLLIY